jgi:glyoxalase/bleomycin resistance protein/dioxygenase superfamily protein
MSATGELLGRIGDGLFQNAFVVADRAAAEQALCAQLGCSEFVDLPATDLEYDVRGSRVSCALALGFARSGNVQIEVIEPVRGESLHAEFLASHGSGSHHLGFLVDDADAVVAFAGARGIAKVMGGEFGRLRFRYLDTFDAIGLYVEIVEDPDQMMMSIMPWR